MLRAPEQARPLGAAPGRITATSSALTAVTPTLPPPTFTVVPALSATEPLPTPVALAATATPPPAPTPLAGPTWLPPANSSLTAAESPPLPTPAGTYSLTVKVPILMYHYVSDPPEDSDKYREDLSVSPAAFRAQMQYLADHGFTTIDFYDLSLAITARKALPAKPVILTFDDGYLDHYQNAFPILREFGFTATFFIITEYVDFGNPHHMTWPMIEEMAAAGMRMEPHSKSHADLREQPREVLVWQILGSQQTLEAHIGYLPRYFCYPGGRYDEDTIAMLEELDFWGAVTTAGGKWHGYNDRYEWSRLRIRYTTTLAEFADLVEPS